MPKLLAIVNPLPRNGKSARLVEQKLKTLPAGQTRRRPASPVNRNQPVAPRRLPIPPGRLKGKLPKSDPRIQYNTATRLTLRSNFPLRFHLDGELFGESQLTEKIEVEVKRQPKRLRIRFQLDFDFPCIRGWERSASVEITLGLTCQSVPSNAVRAMARTE